MAGDKLPSFFTKVLLPVADQEDARETCELALPIGYDRRRSKGEGGHHNYKAQNRKPPYQIFCRQCFGEASGEKPDPHSNLAT